MEFTFMLLTFIIIQ